MSRSSHLLTVADLVLKDGVVRLSRDRPMQSQTALCGVTLPNHRHKRRHCTDGRRIINTTAKMDYLYLSTCLPSPLTVMACGDVDTFTGRVFATELWDPVERLDCEDVCGVRQQAPNFQPATQKAVLCWPVADAVSAGEAWSFGWPADRAPDAVAQVCSATVIQRPIPLQTERGVVNLSDNATWGRGRSYKNKKEPRLNRFLFELLSFKPLKKKSIY